MLSEQVQRDLHKLVLKKIDDAVGDVAQLLDNNEQILHLMVAVALSAATGAAAFMQESMKMPNGKRPPIEACRAKILTFVAEGLGMESKVVTPDEAERIGLK